MDATTKFATKSASLRVVSSTAANLARLKNARREFFNRLLGQSVPGFIIRPRNRMLPVSLSRIKKMNGRVAAKVG